MKSLPSFFDERINETCKIKSGRPILNKPIINEVYGCWKVVTGELMRINNEIECIGRKTRSTNYVLVECDCGSRKWIKTSYLKTNPKSCRECRAEKRNGKWKRLPEGMGVWHDYYNNIKKGARKRKLECNLTPQYLYNLFKEQKGLCAITGIEISQKKGNLSLDRKDSKKGYIIDNVWWVDRKINMIKQELSMGELVNICRLIASRFSEIPADFGIKNQTAWRVG